MHPRPPAPTPRAFGRRTPPPGRPPARRAADPALLGPEAEAFRRTLAERPAAPAGFDAWRRSTRAGRWAAWSASVGLVVAGPVLQLLHAPLLVAAGAEVAGWGLGWRLRRMRRAHLEAVRAWEEPAG